MSALAVPRRSLALEWLLALAFVAMILQLYPSLGRFILWAIDLRNWSSGVWFGLNAVIALALLGVRFVPSVYADWRNRRRRLAVEAAEAARRQLLKDEREALQRIARSRKNRIY